MKSGPISILLLAVCLLVSPNLSAYAESCAKDMFFDQLESPEESINTGLKYWIQLRRNGKVSLVDNRTDFSSGDEIRFQVVPNIAGFAYVVLEKGSTGAKKVLFPNANEPSGKVLPGKQYLLPAKGFLRFDKNAGLETVRVVLSRNPVSEAKLLNGDLSKIVIAAKGTNPSQPIQNDNCLLAFSQAENKPVEFEESEGKGVSGFSKDLVYVPAQG
ncbi:MAG: DUF4384 domain-containing protein, partial [Cyanobacteria bacterium]|nr:DUF4384 domain-containing protein [Cyanobacteriota bacterium]